MEFDAAVQKVVKDIITEHGAVVFNGDGTRRWQVEAAERGLPKLKTTSTRCPSSTGRGQGPVREVGVLSNRELASRLEVYWSSTRSR